MFGGIGCGFGLGGDPFGGCGDLGHGFTHAGDLVANRLDQTGGFAFDGIGHRAERGSAFFFFDALQGNAFFGHGFDLERIVAEDRNGAGHGAEFITPVDIDKINIGVVFT